MSQLLGVAYTVNQASYDLTRLRLNGLITHRFADQHLPAHGRSASRDLYTKVHDRLLRPLIAADQPSAPPDLRHALHVIDDHGDGYIARARSVRCRVR